jgi:hypothetical protein
MIHFDIKMNSILFILNSMTNIITTIISPKIYYERELKLIDKGTYYLYNLYLIETNFVDYQ